MFQLYKLWQKIENNLYLIKIDSNSCYSYHNKYPLLNKLRYYYKNKFSLIILLYLIKYFIISVNLCKLVNIIVI